MSRYNTYGVSSQHASSTKSSNGFNPSLKSERHDERASQSGSEDGSYALYTDPHKIEAELEEESNAALTSQTLNADGTPKRPMNAFMIFARRRRPQVSAENQAMRTGEISKILSKEWVSMPPSEKQFYLEQAKQLKETFNSKYPDYVYRRRPNNSRKRRRSDGGSMRPMDQGPLGDHPDDMAGGFDLDTSPTNADDHIDAGLPSSYPRSSQDMSQGMLDHKYIMGQSHGAHPYHSSDPPFRSNGHHEARLSFSGPSSGDRMGQSLGSSASPRMPISPLQYSYSQPPSHPQSPSIFGGDSVGSHQGWQSRVERVGPNWLGGSQDRLPPPMGGQKQNPYSSTASSNPWSSPGETSTAAANPPPSSPNFFPTLNAPFYPNQPHIPQFQSNAASLPANSLPPQSASSSHYETLSGMPPMPRDFGTSRGYASSNPVTPSAYSLPSGRDHLSFSQRSLPPVQTISGYSHPQPPSSSSSGHGHTPPGFWSRE